MLEPGKLNLQPTFAALRALAEDVENEFSAVKHGEIEHAFDIAFLRGRKRNVEDDDVGPGFAGKFSQLLDLAGTKKGCRIRLVALRLHEADGRQAVRRREKPQFLGRILIKGPADRNNNEESARDLHLARVVKLKVCQISSPSKPAGQPAARRSWRRRGKAQRC